MAISQALSDVPGIGNLLTASNGHIAIDTLKKNPDVDLITLDLEMPVMDGIQTIKEIRKFNKKVIIIVFSSISVKGAEKTLEALTSGANDFVTKQDAGGAKSIDQSLEMIREVLIPKVKAFAKTDLVKKSPLPNKPTTEIMTAMPIKPNMILIGSSTGGPEALSTIFKGIVSNINVPVLIVQHMPALFTEKLAHMLNKLCPHATIREAKIGDRPKAGEVLIAPGDFHMTLEKDGTIGLNQNEKVCFVRPSVNVLLDSVAKNFDSQIAVFILTGMGDDGAAGLKNLPPQKTYYFAQDKSTSIVWGMPGAAVQAIPSCQQLNLTEITSVLNSIFTRI
ncbi:MAG: chemotaxis response regulator protein-glutamate methylesterase [Bacteriovoracaceae bacterium]